MGGCVFSFGHGGCTSFSLDFGCKIARLKGNAKKTRTSKHVCRMALANFPCFLAGAFSFFLRRAVSWPSSIFCRPFKLLEEWLKGAHRQGYKWIQYDTVYMHCMQVTRSNDRCITKTTRQCVPDKHGVSVILWVQALLLSSPPPNSKPGGIERVAAISMGRSAPVWPLPVVWSHRHRSRISHARCTGLHLGRPSRPRTIQQRCFLG